MSLTKVSVIIAGAGPTGLMLGNLLGMAGIDTLILERNAGLSDCPKAIALDDEGLRVCQAAGLGEGIERGGIGALAGSHHPAEPPAVFLPDPDLVRRLHLLIHPFPRCGSKAAGCSSAGVTRRCEPPPARCDRSCAASEGFPAPPRRHTSPTSTLSTDSGAAIRAIRA